jgi:hypothetical protein
MLRYMFLIFAFQTLGGAANNVVDSHVRSRNTWDRPLQQRSDNIELGYLDTVHNLPVSEGNLFYFKCPVVKCPRTVKICSLYS